MNLYTTEPALDTTAQQITEGIDNVIFFKIVLISIISFFCSFEEFAQQNITLQTIETILKKWCYIWLIKKV